MINGTGLAEGLAKTILFIGLLVAGLTGVGAYALSNNLTEVPKAEAEAAGMMADIEQQQQQWEIERPYVEQQLAGEYSVRIAELEQERLLTEAETAAELARIEAATQSYQDGLYDQRQVAWAEHQQALVEADRWNQVVTILAATSGIVLVAAAGAGGVLVVYQKTRPVPVQEVVVAQSYNPWSDPVERRKRIDKIREMDERERTRAIRISRQHEFHNGHPRTHRVPPSKN